MVWRISIRVLQKAGFSIQKMYKKKLNFLFKDCIYYIMHLIVIGTCCYCTAILTVKDKC